MGRSLMRLAGLAMVAATALAAASAATAKRCSWVDDCSKKNVSAYTGGFLVDSCRRAYSVSPTCGLASVRVCSYKDPCRFLIAPRTIWAASGGLLNGGCSTWKVDAACKTTPVRGGCTAKSTSCNAFPVTRYPGDVVSISSGPVCRSPWGGPPLFALDR